MYFSSTTGLIHLIAAGIALVTGTAVLFMRKGTLRHRQVGVLYWLAMGVLLATSFMLYNLFGGWGIFHYLAVVSALTTLGGIIPVYYRSSPKWVEAHLAFMYWSVFGLYAAFVSEVLTRVPEQPFFNMVGIATFATIAVGYVGWFRNKKRWSQQFVSDSVKPRKPLF